MDQEIQLSVNVVAVNRADLIPPSAEYGAETSSPRVLGASTSRQSDCYQMLIVAGLIVVVFVFVLTLKFRNK